MICQLPPLRLLAREKRGFQSSNIWPKFGLGNLINKSLTNTRHSWPRQLSEYRSRGRSGCFKTSLRQLCTIKHRKTAVSRDVKELAPAKACLIPNNA